MNEDHNIRANEIPATEKVRCELPVLTEHVKPNIYDKHQFKWAEKFFGV